MNSFILLASFLIGLICEKYIFPLLDIGMGLLSNKYNLSTSKTQKEINKVMGDSEPIQTNAIGFAYNDIEEFDIEDKRKNKIGFR